MTATVSNLIADGQAALKEGQAAGAHDLFQAAWSLGPNSAALEGLGFAAYLAMNSTRQSTTGSSRTRATVRTVMVLVP